MTRPLIDDRGRVLGLVNIIDILAVQLVAAVATAGVSVVYPDAQVVGAGVVLAVDAAILAALAYWELPDIDEDTSGTDHATIVFDDDVDGTRVIVLELPTGEFVDVDLGPRDTARTDGGGPEERDGS